MEKDEAKANFKKADELFRDHRFDDALVVLDELDDAFPEDRRVLYPRARCLAELSRLDEALQVCDFMVGKWDYDRASRLRDRILAHQVAVSTDGGLDASGVESEGDASATPIPAILLEDDDDVFEFPMSPDLVADESTPVPVPTPLPESSDVKRRYGERIKDIPRTPPPILRKKTAKRKPAASSDLRGGDGDATFWRPVGIVGGSLIVSVVFFVAVASFRGPLSVERVNGILSSMGVPGYAMAAFMIWAANGLVIYGVLHWAAKMPYQNPSENALDVAILGLVVTLLLVVPVVGPVLGVVLVKQKYSLDLRQTCAHFGMVVVALLVVTAVLLLSFSPSPGGTV